MPKLLKETVLDKILLLFLKKSNNKALSTLKKDPEFKSDIERLQIIAQELEDHGEKVIKKIHNKYKGTMWEKYF